MATLHLVSTPIGNLGDLSTRAGAVLGSVSRVLAEDTRRTRILMDHLQLRTPLVSFHTHNAASRTEEALGWLDTGEDVALVTDAGTPAVSDPGERLVEAALKAGHGVSPVPGPSAVLAALVASGLPTTPFVFLGFPPRKGGERAAFLERVAGSAETAVLFESPERVVALLEALAPLTGPDRRVVVARELTKVHESFFRGTLGEATSYYRENPARGEVTVVVAPTRARTEPDEVDEAAARALARALLDEGLSPSRTARELARRLDLPRNLAYDIVHDLP